MTQLPGLPPEGWYPNPENHEQQRWWDGRAWTEHVAVGAPMAPGAIQQSAALPGTSQPGPTPPGPTQPEVPAAPSYPAPGYQAPGYQAPGYQAPGYQAPGYQAPGYQPQGWPSAPPVAGYPAYPSAPGHQGYQTYPGAPGAAGPRGVLPDGAHVAGWWMRFLARFIDGFIVLVPGAIISLPLIRDVVHIFRRFFNQVQAAVDANQTPPDASSLLAHTHYLRDVILIALIVSAVTVVYEVIMLKAFSATIGKLICGLRVRDWSVRGKLTWRAILLRVLTYQVAQGVPQVGGLYNLLDCLFPLWDSKKQAIHDKAARTAVVHKYDA